MRKIFNSEICNMRVKTKVIKSLKLREILIESLSFETPFFCTELSSRNSGKG